MGLLTHCREVVAVCVEVSAGGKVTSVDRQLS